MEKENKFNNQEYLFEKVGECVAGISFLKWMLAIFIAMNLYLLTLVFNINSKVSGLSSGLNDILVKVDREPGSIAESRYNMELRELSDRDPASITNKYKESSK